jgi:hypothetical protein
MRIRFISLLAIAAALLFPAAALARTTKVVPFKSVEGVPLKLTPAQYRKRLGRPSHVIHVSGKIAEYEYTRLDLSVMFDTNHHPDRADFVGVVVGPFTKKIRFHTVHGIHIGSSKAAVRRAFGRKCHWDLGQCAIWKGTPGADNSTSFNITFEQGKVVQFNNQYVFKDF